MESTKSSRTKLSPYLKDTIHSRKLGVESKDTLMNPEFHISDGYLCNAIQSLNANLLTLTKCIYSFTLWVAFALSKSKHTEKCCIPRVSSRVLFLDCKCKTNDFGNIERWIQRKEYYKSRKVLWIST